MFAALTAWYAQARRDARRATCSETNAHLLATRSLLEESARDRERLRLARELHDVAGHKLTALKLNLTALERAATAAAQPAIKVASQLATELLDDIRGVVAQIRQHDGLDLRAGARRNSSRRCPSPRDPPGGRRGRARRQRGAGRDAAARGAGGAHQRRAACAGAANAWIELRREGDVVRLSMRDDGRGVVPLREGFGLAGMRERLAPVGGTLDISRASAGGVALDITAAALLMAAARIALADDQALVREGLKLVLRSLDIEIAVEAADGRELIDKLARHSGRRDRLGRAHARR